MQSNDVANMIAPRISIVVLNHNGRNWLNGCLSSILKQKTKEKFEVIMVDNGSTDNSVEYVQTHFPQVKIIALDRNYGIAQGNNLGIEHAKGQYLIFVNNDTVAENGWLQNLVEVADNHPEYQVLCSILLPSLEKNRTITLGVFGKVIRSSHQSNEAVTDSLLAHAASFLIRKEWIWKMGYLFDPNYFMFAEDLEFPLRTILMGGCIGYVRDSRIHHYGGGSGYAPTWAYELIMRNNLTTYYKLFSLKNLLRILLANTIYIIGRLILRPWQLAETSAMIKGSLEFFPFSYHYRDYRKNFSKSKIRDARYVLQRLLCWSIIEKILKKVLYGC